MSETQKLRGVIQIRGDQMRGSVVQSISSTIVSNFMSLELVSWGEEQGSYLGVLWISKRGGGEKHVGVDETIGNTSCHAVLLDLASRAECSDCDSEC